MPYEDKEYKFIKIDNKGIDLKILSEPVVIYKRTYVPCLEVEVIDTSEKFYMAISAYSTARHLSEIFESYGKFTGLKIHVEKDGPDVTSPIVVSLRGSL